MDKETTENANVLVWRELLNSARAMRRGQRLDVARAVLDMDLENEFSKRLQAAAKPPKPAKGKNPKLVAA